MRKTPLISVIMGVYNGEKYLQESIKSVLAQTYPDFEFIIINDGSTDDSGVIIEQHANRDKRIKVIHQDNHGLAHALNVGLQAAQGDFIARMDDDDICFPNRLEAQSRVLLENQNIRVCHSLFGLIDDKGRAIPFRSSAGFRYSALQTRWTLLWRNCICHPTVMIRHDILKRFNMTYDASVICQDYELWCRLIEVTDFFTIRKPLIYLRKHSSSVSSHYDEIYLSKFSGVIARNLEKYIDNIKDPADLRAITLLSGQMYLRGKKNTHNIDARSILPIFETVTSRFIDLHSDNKKTDCLIQRAAARQLIRWAQQSWFNNKRAAIRFLVSGIKHYFFKLYT